MRFHTVILDVEQQSNVECRHGHHDAKIESSVVAVGQLAYTECSCHKEQRPLAFNIELGQ
jgi:hypothetical protein